MHQRERGTLYSITFSDQECSGVAARDVFELTGSTNSRLRLHEVNLSQHVNVVGASAERLKVEVLTGGAGTKAAGGVAGVPIRFLDKGATALTTGSFNSTTIGLASSDETLRHGDTWPLNENFNYCPASDKRIQTALGERLSVRLGINAAAIGISGSIVWEEIGKVPGENDS